MLAGVASGGVYKSTDGGATWKPPAPGNGMVRSETVWSIDRVPSPASSSRPPRAASTARPTPAPPGRCCNDGITGTVLRVFKDDDSAPNIYYAAGTDGIFRTINGGVTWSKINAGAAQRAGRHVRAMKQLSRRRPHAPVRRHPERRLRRHDRPQPVPRRGQVAQGHQHAASATTRSSGRSSNFLTTPGTLLAGTQSNGGYVLTFTPPINTVDARRSAARVQVGKTLTANDGHVDRHADDRVRVPVAALHRPCATCADIDGATEKTFVDPGRLDRRALARRRSTGKNDFPTLRPQRGRERHHGTDHHPAPGPLPGVDQQSKASVGIDLPGDGGQPQPGDVARAKDWLFNPAADVSHDVPVVDLQGRDCVEIPGATGMTYTIREADVDGKLCVAVTGRNASGATTLECGGQTNTILSEDPKQLAPATLQGSAYVGDTLVSTVGAWKTGLDDVRPPLDALRAPTAAAASTIAGREGRDVQAQGRRPRQAPAGARSTPTPTARTCPPAIYVYTPLSAVVTTPPPPPADPRRRRRRRPRRAASRRRSRRRTRPRSRRRVRPRTPSRPSSASAPSRPSSSRTPRSSSRPRSPRARRCASPTSARSRGRKVGKTCKAGAKKGKKCTSYKKLATVKVRRCGRLVHRDPAQAQARRRRLPRRRHPDRRRGQQGRGQDRLVQGAEEDDAAAVRATAGPTSCSSTCSRTSSRPGSSCTPGRGCGGPSTAR